MLFFFKFFGFDSSPKKIIMFCLLVCLAAMVFKVNIANIQCFSVFLDIQAKYLLSQSLAS